MVEVRSPLQGTVVSFEADVGDVVRAGAVVVLIESMKMHHDVVAPERGRVAELLVNVGAAVMPGDVLATPSSRRRRRAEPATADGQPSARPPARRWSGADLAESVERHRVGLDEARPGRRRPATRPKAGARPARTSPTSSTRARSSSTGRSSSPPSAAGASSTT